MLPLTLIPALCLLGAPSPAGGAAATNVLVVVADDLSQRELAPFSRVWPNARPVPAPHVEGLAREGVTFFGVHSNPTCSPSRAAMLTGRYGFRTGIGKVVGLLGQFDLSFDEVTLPEVAGAAGVATAFFGKWHVSSQGQVPGTELVTLEPNLHGFGDYLAGSLHGSVSDYYDWERVDNGIKSTETTYATTAQAQACIDWIEAAPPGWLAVLSFNAPHNPFHAPPPSLLPPGSPVPQTDRQRFQAAVMALDRELGRVLEVVDLRETTVLFLADNGTPGEVAHPQQDPAKLKGSLFRESIEVPCIVAGAGVPDQRRGTADFGLRSVADVFAESLHQLGIAAPPGAGEDSLPLLAHPGRRVAFSERFKPNGFGPFDLEERTVRGRRYKLMVLDGSERFFDLWADPTETVDLLRGQGLERDAARAYGLLSQALEALVGG